MTKLRIYYDKDGDLKEVEHRIAEDYTNENANRDDIKWIVVDSGDLGKDPPENFAVKRRKLVKKS